MAYLEGLERERETGEREERRATSRRVEGVLPMSFEIPSSLASYLETIIFHSIYSCFIIFILSFIVSFMSSQCIYGHKDTLRIIVGCPNPHIDSH